MVGQVAERHAGLRLIIDHFGRPSGTKDEAAWANLSELLALAKYPNVAVKATGAPSYSSAPYPYRNIHTYIRQLYDAFGPERLFWGTDITRMPCSWRQCVTMFTEELPWLSASDKDLIMGRPLHMARLAAAGMNEWHVSPVRTTAPAAGGAALIRTRATRRPSQQ